MPELVSSLTISDGETFLSLEAVSDMVNQLGWGNVEASDLMSYIEKIKEETEEVPDSSTMRLMIA